MPPELMSPIGLICFFIPIALVCAWFLVSQVRAANARNETWSAWAQTHGFTMKPGSLFDNPVVSGELDGTDVPIEIRGVGKDSEARVTLGEHTSTEKVPDPATLMDRLRALPAP